METLTMLGEAQAAMEEVAGYGLDAQLDAQNDGREQT
jgi:hypothetical protein